MPTAAQADWRRNWRRGTLIGHEAFAYFCTTNSAEVTARDTRELGPVLELVGRERLDRLDDDVAQSVDIIPPKSSVFSDSTSAGGLPASATCGVESRASCRSVVVAVAVRDHAGAACSSSAMTHCSAWIWNSGEKSPRLAIVPGLR